MDQRDITRRTFMQRSSLALGIGLTSNGANCRQQFGNVIREKFTAEIPGGDNILGLPISVYYHRDCVNSPAVLFSHGFSGGARIYESHLIDIARKDYFVIAPDHYDYLSMGTSFLPFSLDLIGAINKLTNLGEQLSNAGININNAYECGMWLLETGLSGGRFHDDDTVHNQIMDIITEGVDYRVRDIALALEKVAGEYGHLADLNNIGLIGHSLGGYGVGVCNRGGSPLSHQRHIEGKWDASIKFAICQAPASGILTQIGQMKPTMWMVGDADNPNYSVLPYEQVLGCASVANTHYFLTVANAGHYSFCSSIMDILEQLQQEKADAQKGPLLALFDGTMPAQAEAHSYTGPIIQKYVHDMLDGMLKNNLEALINLQDIWTDQFLVRDKSFIREPER
ncbi:MAG: hypothetical protein V1740_01750 [Candidatus Woesearchaeota archaeon]